MKKLIISILFLIGITINSYATNLSSLYANRGLPATGQTTSYATGDDGDLEKGAAKRYSYSDDGTIDTEAENILTDSNTGLMWIRDHTLVTGSETEAGGNQDISAKMNWATALSRSNALDYGGYTDWRLPNAYEFLSICLLEPTHGAPFIDTTAFPNTVSSYYWSSTTYSNNTDYALVVDFNAGLVSRTSKTNSYYVRCVRGGQ